MSQTRASVVATGTISRDESNAAKQRSVLSGVGEGLVSKHIGYIPRDLSRDNWQICREEVVVWKRVSRDKSPGISPLSAASEFQIFPSSPRPGRDSLPILREEESSFASFVRSSSLPRVPISRFRKLAEISISDDRSNIKIQLFQYSRNQIG